MLEVLFTTSASTRVLALSNYCTSKAAFESKKVTDDPHPVVLCLTDNTSALNWTLHTSKKSIIGQALVRFFLRVNDWLKCWGEC